MCDDDLKCGYIKEKFEYPGTIYNNVWKPQLWNKKQLTEIQVV